MTTHSTYEELQQKMADFEKKAKERLKFEKLLTELSTIFINIPSDEIDEKVETVLRRIGEILDVDRTEFVQFIGDPKQLKITHSWTAKGIKRHPLIDAQEHYPWAILQLSKGKHIIFSSPDDLPKKADRDRESLKRMGIKSGMIIPYTVEKELVCVIAFGSHRHYRQSWPEAYIQRLKLLGEVISNAFLRKQADQELRGAFDEIKKLKDQLQKENIYLLEEIKSIQKRHEIIGESQSINDVLIKIEQVANTDSTVLILGETGTGKEMVANAVHNFSLRSNRAMVTVNCAGLPATLIESELFGREKGAYTGAISKQVGRFEIADGSTLFLDEIGDLPVELQVKLLRVLQQGQFERLGSSKTIRVDVRVIAATNRDLQKAIQKEKFREDLYYRLNVFPIQVPPLRERTEDVLPLTWAFIHEFSGTMGKRINQIAKSSLDALQNYQWPGNIRELRNVIERAVIMSKGRTLMIELPASSTDKTQRHTDLPLEEYERRYIIDILKKTGWRIRGKKGAAEILGLKPTTLYSRMKKLEILRPENSSDQ